MERKLLTLASVATLIVSFITVYFFFKGVIKK